MRLIRAALPGPWLGRFKLILGVTTGLVAATLLALGLARLPADQRDAAGWTEHTLEVIASASTLEAHLYETESAGRAYYLSHIPPNAELFAAGGRKIASDLAALRALVAENPEQLATLDRLQPLAEHRIGIMRSVIGLFERGNPELANAILALRLGRSLMDQMAECVEGIKAEERDLLARRQETAQLASRRVVRSLLGLAVLAAASGFAVVFVRIGRRRERDHVAALQTINADLEARVAARTAEVAGSEVRQRGYFDNSPIGIMIGTMTPAGLIVEDINPAAEQMYAIERATTLGRTAHEVWPGPLGEEIENRLLGCLRTGKTVQYRAARQPRGTTRQFDIIVAPLHGPDGDARSVIVCARDVTAERVLEQQVVEAAERQAEAAERELALFRNSGDVLVILRVEEGEDGPDMYYELLSPALERLTGLHADQMLGLRPQDCLPPDIADAILPRYRLCVASGETVTYTQTYAMPVGVRDYEGAISPVMQGTTGRVIRLVATLRDVTERNRMEAALRHGQKMEAIGRLAAGVAHDFNNILQSVMGGLELVLDETPPATPARQFAAMALGAAQRGAALTHHLLSYARKQILRPRTVNFATFLPEMELVLGRTLGPHIAVDVHADDALPPVHADPGQLETALLNLAINAAHAMPKGGTLSLRASADGTGLTHVVLTVTDTGRGMDAQTLAQAFEPFFTTKGLEGTGLGLSMVQGFIEQSGGTIRIDSAPGRGTTVAMRLPVARDVVAVSAPEPEAPAVAGRILLVDDVDDVLLTTQAMLESAGFDVVAASSGREAIGVLAEGTRFDALVTDFAMPGMNGSELIEQGRCFQPDLPALIVTGYAELRREERPGGPAALLNKPFSRDQLVAALRTLLGAETGVPDGGAAPDADDRAEPPRRMAALLPD